MEKDRKPGGLPPMDDDMANELEVLRLMKDYQSGGKSAEVDKAAAEVENPAAPPEDDPLPNTGVVSAAPLSALLLWVPALLLLKTKSAK